MTRLQRICSAFRLTPRLVSLVYQASPRLFSATLVLTLLSALSPVGLLYVNKLIIDSIVSSVTHSDIRWLNVSILVATKLALSLFQIILAELLQYSNQILLNRFSLEANERLIRKVSELDVESFESSKFFDLLKRAQQNGSSYPVKSFTLLSSLTGNIVNLISVSILLFTFNPGLILILIVINSLTFFIRVEHSNSKLNLLKKNTLQGRLSGYIQGLLLNHNYAKEIRQFNLGGYLLKRWRTLQLDFNREVEGMIAQYSRGKIYSTIIPQLGFYGAYFWIISQALLGIITIGDFSMFSGGFSQSQSLLQKITANFSNLYEANLFVGEYYLLFDLEPKIISSQEPTSFPNPIQSGFELKNVSFTYPEASKPALKNINLHIAPGESIALVGFNGAGKSTLVQLLSRLYDVSSGEICLDGVPLQRYRVEELRKNIAIIFQNYAQYSLSVSENIGFGSVNDMNNQEQIVAAAKLSGAYDFIQDLPDGFDTKLGKIFPGGTKLSGGQWQKIGLARAFMSPAQILVLDEPTAALDAIAEFELFKQFQELARGKMTILIAHRFSSVRLADRIVVLKKGQIVEVGTHTELMDQKGLYHEMFTLQAEGYQ